MTFRRIILLAAVTVFTAMASWASQPDSISTVTLSDTMLAANNPQKPPKRYFRAAAEVIGINAGVHLFDRVIMNEEFAQTTWNSVGRNLKSTWVWDNDGFTTNLISHPYHGSLYFNSARSNGLSFFESIPYTLAGSAMWEIAGEREPPSVNDIIATTSGGICIGEVTNRLTSLILRDDDTGFSRFLREASSTLICPMRELNRIITGDAWRHRTRYCRYHDYDALPVDFSVTPAMRYLADDGAFLGGEFNPTVTFYLNYGDPFSDEQNRPYDYFSIEATVGLSSNQPLVNKAHILGRIWSANIYQSREIEAQYGIYQHFNYYNSSPVRDGTDTTPYRFSEASGVGPGLIMKFPSIGIIKYFEQQIHSSLILLGGSKTDYYSVIDRDYNLGSGYSFKFKTLLDFDNFGRFILKFNYFRIFTWKGYESEDLDEVNPLFLNAQGDNSNTRMVALEPIFEFDLNERMSLNASGAFYDRHTYYKYHPNVNPTTYEISIGMTWHF